MLHSYVLISVSNGSSDAWCTYILCPTVWSLSLSIAIGTLPYVDNFSQIGGFIFGVLASFIFVPYITLGKWDRAIKLCLILTSLPIVITLFLFGFVIFYFNTEPNFCPECSYINCIPYTPTFCSEFITTVLGGIIPPNSWFSVVFFTMSLCVCVCLYFNIISNNYVYIMWSVKNCAQKTAKSFRYIIATHVVMSKNNIMKYYAQCSL